MNVSQKMSCLSYKLRGFMGNTTSSHQQGKYKHSDSHLLSQFHACKKGWVVVVGGGGMCSQVCIDGLTKT